MNEVYCTWYLYACAHAYVGAALFAAYLNPYAGYTVESVSSTLDQLAEEVAECLLKQELQETGRLDGLGEPPYLPHVNGVITDQTKICKAINTVLYTVHGFKGNAEDYYNIDNSLIHEVRERMWSPVCIWVECTSR